MIAPSRVPAAHIEIVAPALLSAGQVAEYVGMSRRWIYRAMSAGEFPRPVKIGKSTRWRRADLDQWIAEL